MGTIQTSTGKGNNTVNTTTVWDRIVNLENNVGVSGTPIKEKVDALETSLAQKATKTDIASLASKDYVNSQILTVNTGGTIDLSNKADLSYVNSRVSKVINNFPPNLNKNDSQRQVLLTPTSLTGWSPTSQLVVDNSITYNGNPTLKFTHAVSQSSPYSDFTFASAINMTTMDYIELMVYIDNQAAISAGSILRFYSGTSHFSADAYRHINPIFGQLNGWKRVRVNKSEFTVTSGTPDWSNITKMRFNPTMVGSMACNINVALIDSISSKKGLLAIDFDDGRISQYTNAYPILQKYNIKATAYLITSTVGTTGAISWSQARELRDAGWTVGSHTDTHAHIDQITRDQIIKEFDDSQRKLRLNGLYSGSYFLSAPYGAWSQIAWEEAVKRFVYCRVFRQIPTYDMRPLNDNLLSAYSSVENTHTVADMKAKIDTIIANKTAYNMTFHDISDSLVDQYNWKATDFEALMQYVAQKRDEGVLDVLTAEERILQYKGIETEYDGQHSIVSSDGVTPILLKLNRV